MGNAQQRRALASQGVLSDAQVSAMGVANVGGATSSSGVVSVPPCVVASKRPILVDSQVRFTGPAEEMAVLELTRESVGVVKTVDSGSAVVTFDDRELTCLVDHLARAVHDEPVRVKFEWAHGGNEVLFAASFTGWKPIPMVRSGNEFAIIQEVPRGVHQYKFICDTVWKTSPDQKTAQDDHGNVNNIVDISKYEPFSPIEPDVPLRFGQVIPTVAEYTTDAPSIPQTLAKSPPVAMNTGPLKDRTAHIPTHAFSDHVYLSNTWNDPGKDVSLTAVTHRYGRKYSTLVFATRNVHVDKGQNGQGAPVNLLKRAVRRR